MCNAKVENRMTFQSSLFDDFHLCSNTVSRFFGIVFPLCLLTNVFVVSANTSFRKLCIQWSCTNIYGIFGQNQVEFTTANIEKNPDVEPPPHSFHCEGGREGGASASVFFSTYAAVKSTRQ